MRNQQLKIYQIVGARVNKSSKMNSQLKKKLIQAPYPPNMNDNFNLQLKYDLAKQYKHIKSNSEAVNHHGRNLNDSAHGEIEQIYSNRKGLRISNYSPDKQMYASHATHDDQNMVIFSNDFNTVKYSQSPFLNKLTSLKQKILKKDSAEKESPKGHKSRNSMFPKSYTYQRREPEIYSKLSLRKTSIGKIDEENVPLQDTKASNPYTNINPYENDHNERQANFIVKDCDQKTIQLGSDKKRAPTDTTRSRTGVNVTGESARGASYNKDGSDISHKRPLPVSADKFPFQKHIKKPHDYYQVDNKNANEVAKKGEIISILSMEIGESDDVSSSYSPKNNKRDPYKMDSKNNLKKVLGIDYFENQKTLKQNMEFLIANIDYDNEVVKPTESNLNVLGQRPVESRRQKLRRVEYRERLEEEKGHHKKSKSQKGNKHQYIRNNHDIISKNQKNKSSDSTENSILKKSNGFEILYKRGEKLEKLLNHHDSYEPSNRTSYAQEDIYNVESVADNDESSSISNIENSKAIEISYRTDDDII